MRNWLLILTLLALLTIPVSARAQGGPGLEILSVQLLPEEDQSSVLVIYNLKLAADAALPATLEIALPGEAKVNAVAQEDQGGLVNVPYSVAVEDGSRVIAFTATSSSLFYRVEYYQPYERNGEHRHFVFQWDGRYAVAVLRVDLKEPVDSLNVTTEPPLNDITQGDQGFVYHAATFSGLEAGSPLTIVVDYDKTSENLNVAGGKIQPSQNVDEDTPGRVSVETFMPWIIGAIGLVMIAIGLLYLARTNRSGRVRRRHHASVEESSESEVYCHQCGQRARPADRFCRSCGSRLRVETDD